MAAKIAGSNPVGSTRIQNAQGDVLARRSLMAAKITDANPVGSTKVSLNDRGLR